ncbi:toxin-antitoxin system YwqK family antitoxin [Tenacibaculum finnmarkense]|uniref:toxin-antitoxin system YwqK family antitoxin n=1 Tax=Tenacibaculum finnmarkense TaxID=2781243 RepID=UPI001E6037F8|nr:hypothetical protein [Tenacibaculum finnmarkense]MCD8413000.1 hypothetical protein [Tenacibaculum finnmarkense genomovar ulcerans]
MKIKIALIVILMFFSRNLFAQKDSIVNFFDKKGIITKNKEKARSFQIITKKEDSLWLVRNFRKSGTLYNYSYSISKENKVKRGKSVFFNKYGKKTGELFYDQKGNKQGKSQRWFDNDSLNITGFYLAGKREGIWKAYHYNGKLAARVVFKNDSVLKTTYYNNNNNTEVVANKEALKHIKPIFKGGNKKYIKNLKRLTKKITFKVKGKIIVNYIIDVNGTIKDVTIDEKMPEKLKKEIIVFFENLKGWEPAVYLNRKIPYNFSQPLNFNN